MSVYHLDRALMPLGGLVGEVLADTAGATWAFISLGAICMAAILVIGAAGEAMRKL